MSDEFKVEKHVPVPPPRAIYPWSEMEVGDSFFVDDPRLRERISSAAAKERQRSGKRFTVRKVRGGLRVWRVE